MQRKRISSALFFCWTFLFVRYMAKTAHPLPFSWWFVMFLPKFWFLWFVVLFCWGIFSWSFCEGFRSYMAIVEDRFAIVLQRFFLLVITYYLLVSLFVNFHDILMKLSLHVAVCDDCFSCRDFSLYFVEACFSAWVWFLPNFLFVLVRDLLMFWMQ